MTFAAKGAGSAGSLTNRNFRSNRLLAMASEYAANVGK